MLLLYLFAQRNFEESRASLPRLADDDDEVYTQRVRAQREIEEVDQHIGLEQNDVTPSEAI